jgi:dienelactone hydrolase
VNGRWGQQTAAHVIVGVTALVSSGGLQAQTTVTFETPDRATIQADVYSKGARGIVVIGHGGYSSRTSWKDEARSLADAGFRTLVFDTRAAVELSAGKETPCLYDASCMAIDALAAVRYLRQTGATRIAVMGGSAGGGAAAKASIHATPGEIDRLVLLAPVSIDAPEQMKGKMLFVVSREDLGSDDRPRLPGIRAQYEKVLGPKELLVLDGSAHGQRIFGTAQGGLLTRDIVRFLNQP